MYDVTVKMSSGERSVVPVTHVALSVNVLIAVRKEDTCKIIVVLMLE